MPDTATSAPAPVKIEWVLWHREGTRAKWRPVMVGRTEKEVINAITAQGKRGDWFWNRKGDPDPNARPRG